VRRWRERRGLTQAALAEKAGLDLRHVQRVERARTNTGVLALVQIAVALGVAPGALFRRAAAAAPTRGRPPRKAEPGGAGRSAAPTGRARGRSSG
jgi:transcriptional regulator with XRE-family HTH domain